MKRCIAVVLVCCGFVACGDDGGEKDPLSTAAGFCKEWAEAACNKDVVESCSEDPDVDACRESQVKFCRSMVSSSKYKKRGVEECLAGVEKAYADARITAEEAQTVLRMGPPCSRVLGGGEPSCEKEADCSDTDGPVCEIPEGLKVGTCRLSGGLSCEDSELECASTFFCNGENCVARLGEGKECESDRECKPTLKCAESEDEEGINVCTPRKDTGEECEEHDECQSQLCSDGECTTRVILNDRSEMCDDLR